MNLENLTYQEIHGGRINFNIIQKNSENNSTNYKDPTFFTDCSNPITLGYVNKDIVSKYKVSKDNNLIVFDGKILKTAGVDLKSIGCNINFTIHIKNNLDEEYIYNTDINISLEDETIYEGFSLKVKSKFNDDNKFFNII